MTTSDPSAHDRFRDRYLAGDVPWDHTDPPPEVIQLASQLDPGRALDLGCGHGRASLYLARHGWEVDGVDFVAEAIDEARRRALAAGVQGRTRFLVGDVTDLSGLAGPYDVAIDVGCSHRLPPEGLRMLRGELTRLLRPSGQYLLFSKLGGSHQDHEPERRWMDERVLLEVFREGFVLERTEHGETARQEGPPSPSAWYWFRKQGDRPHA